MECCDSQLDPASFIRRQTSPRPVVQETGESRLVIAIEQGDNGWVPSVPSVPSASYFRTTGRSTMQGVGLV